MKKNGVSILMVAAMAMVVVSCGKDKDESTGKRLAKVSSLSYNETYEYGQLTGTSGSYNETTISWQGNHLQSLMDGRIEFIYSGDRIHDVIVNEGSQPVHMEFSYDGDRVSQIYSTTSNSWEITKFTYNEQGELIVAEELNEKSITHLTWHDGNVIRVEKSRTSGGNNYSTVYEYIYDNKHKAYEGFEAFALISNGNYYMLSKGNLLKETITEGSYTRETNHIYSYEGDYPLTERIIHQNDNYSYYDYSNHVSTNYYQYSDGTSATLPTVVTINATPNNEAYGYVDGGGKYALGSKVVLRASSITGYGYFVCWSDGNTENPRTITATSDANFTAVFEMY